MEKGKSVVPRLVDDQRVPRSQQVPPRPDATQPPEAPGLKTTFKSEKVKSALQAGKILMQYKTQELAEPGEAKADYAEQVKRVKQGVSEAILQEEIPPQYQKTIQDYFDNYQAEPGKGGASKE